MATIRNIRQNLFFGFIYNAIGVPLTAGVLFPACRLLLNPAIAAAAMGFSSVSEYLEIENDAAVSEDGRRKRLTDPGSDALYWSDTKGPLHV